ncbi:substrate-binding domain-containing protein [Sorangium sp. So ce119]|uniref:ABC transporter substrate-binding protein n=1 Tax=Sorangium sp. So ce119 TaxID=3133279 RepID=UPI003F60A8FF
MNANVLACALAVTLLAACSRTPSEAASTDAGAAARSGARLRIAVVPKGTTHEFWKSVHAGAVKASRELDVDVVWKGPLREDDLKAQIDVVASFVAQGVSGIVLAPLNDAALKAPVRAAAQAKIPVVVFDSDLAGDEHVSFVATDNHAAGKLAGEHLGKAIGDKGRVVMLRYQEGSASTQRREQGFLDAVRALPGVTIASENQYGGATTETAFKRSESLLLALNAAEGAIDGVFTPNESTTFGMLQALRKTNVARKVKFVGFDTSEKLLGALRDGDIEALVVQHPFNMGYVAVKTMVTHLRGEPVEKRIDTGSRVVTRQDLDDPAVKEIVSPDLARWLGE